MGAVKNIVNSYVNSLDEHEKVQLKIWVEQASTIVNDPEKNKIVKIKNLKELSTNKTGFEFFKSALKQIKKHAWQQRSIPAKLAMLGAAVGIGGAGLGGAGVAAMGTAIGVPVYLLTASGGALLGTIIKELSDSKEKS